MNDDWEMRRTALVEGATYRVMREAESRPDGAPFKIGEAVRLRQIVYSHYDNSHVYTFEEQGEAERSYWLHDDEPLERLTETFGS